MSGRSRSVPSAEVGRIPAVNVGRRWISHRGAGGLGHAASLVTIAMQVIIEGRLGEVAADLGREFVSPLRNPVIRPGNPAYSWHGDHLEAERESPILLGPLGAQLDGVCHAIAKRSHVWAWRGNCLLTVDIGAGAAEEIHRFPERITTMHRTPSGNLIVALKGSVHLSSDGGLHFSEVLRLSHDWSRVKPHTLADAGRGLLLLGEYGNVRDQAGRWIPTAWVHWTTDEGLTWASSDFLIRAGVNKHVHVVAACPMSSRLFVTSGDNRKSVWTNSFEEGERGGGSGTWQLTHRGPWSLGGYTAVAFTRSATYWGTDYWMGTNFVVAEDRGGRTVRWMPGGPLRRNPIRRLAVIPGPNGNYLLATSASPYRGAGSSALLAFAESSQEWSALLLDRNDGRSIQIAECSADPACSWTHVRLRGQSFMVVPEAARVAEPETERAHKCHPPIHVL